MELDLIEHKNENLGINDYFKLEYQNQDVKNKPEFKKWYKNSKEKIYKEVKILFIVLIFMVTIEY